MAGRHGPGRLAAACALGAALGAVVSMGTVGCSSSDARTTAGPSTTTSGTAKGTATTTTVGAAPYTSALYADPAHWLCRPDTTGDACDADLDATRVAADGTTTVEPFRADPDAPVDCFYAYPTISADSGPNSDLTADAERSITTNQVARLGSVCRVFAPLYRSVTLGYLARTGDGDIVKGTAPPGQPASPAEVAYADVRDAFRQYLAHDNHGRPFVLVGHSQGAGHLRQLVHDEIDDVPAVRKHLVSAILLGEAVRSGVGGPPEFAHVPPCHASTDTGCVVAYSTFAADSPPPADSYFGFSDTGPGRAQCTNPAAMGGGPAPLDSYFPAGHAEGAPTVATPWIHYPGLVTAECTADDHFDWLRVTTNPSPAGAWPTDVGGRLTPQWGLHMVDVNLAQGSLIDLIRTQGTRH